MRTVLVLLSLTATAQAELRQAVVDVRQALEESDAGKLAKQKLLAQVQRRQKEIEGQTAELEKLRAEFEKQRPVLSVSLVDQKQRDL